MREFELVSGLGVNVYKSKLYDINVKDSFLKAVSYFMKCSVGFMLFIFLGIPIGANLRKKITWNSILKNFQSKFSSWVGKKLFFWWWDNFDELYPE